MPKPKLEMQVFKVDDHYTVSSESDEKKLYRVFVDEREPMNTTCDCVSYILGKKRPCKHGCEVLKILAEGFLIPTQMEKDAIKEVYDSILKADFTPTMLYNWLILLARKMYDNGVADEKTQQEVDPPDGKECGG